MSCDKDGAGCCKGHKTEGSQAAAKTEGESCCPGDCCKDGGCCAGHEKEGAAVVKTSADDKAASCCAEGAECCKDGAGCCKAHKAAGQTASAEGKQAGCECCGTSCPMHAGR